LTDDAACLTIGNMQRDSVLAVRIPHEVKEAVRRAGEADHGRSLSGMVVRILREWCEANGYLAPEADVEAPKRRGRKG
jgi:hypothetical protein